MVTSTLSSLEPHFENALTLMHAAVARRDRPLHSVKAMEIDLRPHLLVTPKGKIIYANDASLKQFGLLADDSFDRAMFQSGQFDLFIKALRMLDTFPNHQIVATFGIQSMDDDTIIRVGLRSIRGENDETLGQLTALSTSWKPDVAAMFKTAMQITPVELEIARAIVTGMSLSDLAAERQRAVGTVRLQAKTLLKKLHLRSQTELVSLYTGFAELHGFSSPDGSGDATYAQPSHLLTCADGRTLEYEVAGPIGGRPVLFFPALLGGTALTPQMRRLLVQKKVRLIMVWRPGFANSDVDGPATRDAFIRHAEDLKLLLAQLNIQSCPVIGHITSAMFAYAMGFYASDHVDKIVIVNGIVPAWSGDHVTRLDKSERLRFMLMRRAPKIGRMIVHATLSKVDAGFDEEFLAAFVNNDVDRKTMQETAIRETFRGAFTKTITQGYDCFVHELSMASLDWEPLVAGITCPAHLLIGEKNPFYTPDLVGFYAKDRPHLSVTTVPDTAHLLLYQNFERVLEATVPTLPAAHQSKKS